jgi:hypothetical protein
MLKFFEGNKMNRSAIFWAFDDSIYDDTIINGNSFKQTHIELKLISKYLLNEIKNTTNDYINKSVLCNFDSILENNTIFYENFLNQNSRSGIKIEDKQYLLAGWPEHGICIFWEKTGVTPYKQSENVYRFGIINLGDGTEFHGKDENYFCNGIIFFDNILESKIKKFLNEYKTLLNTTWYDNSLLYSSEKLYYIISTNICKNDSYHINLNPGKNITRTNIVCKPQKMGSCTFTSSIHILFYLKYLENSSNWDNAIEIKKWDEWYVNQKHELFKLLKNEIINNPSIFDNFNPTLISNMLLYASTIIGESTYDKIKDTYNKYISNNGLKKIEKDKNKSRLILQSIKKSVNSTLQKYPIYNFFNFLESYDTTNINIDQFLIKMEEEYYKMINRNFSADFINYNFTFIFYLMIIDKIIVVINNDTNIQDKKTTIENKLHKFYDDETLKKDNFLLYYKYFFKYLQMFDLENKEGNGIMTILLKNINYLPDITNAKIQSNNNSKDSFNISIESKMPPDNYKNWVIRTISQHLLNIDYDDIGKILKMNILCYNQDYGINLLDLFTLNSSLDILTYFHKNENSKLFLENIPIPKLGNQNINTPLFNDNYSANIKELPNYDIYKTRINFYYDKLLNILKDKNNTEPFKWLAYFYLCLLKGENINEEIKKTYYLITADYIPKLKKSNQYFYEMYRKIIGFPTKSEDITIYNYFYMNNKIKQDLLGNLNKIVINTLIEETDVSNINKITINNKNYYYYKKINKKNPTFEMLIDYTNIDENNLYNIFSFFKDFNYFLINFVITLNSDGDMIGKYKDQEIIIRNYNLDNNEYKINGTIYKIHSAKSISTNDIVVKLYYKLNKYNKSNDILIYSKDNIYYFYLHLQDILFIVNTLKSECKVIINDIEYNYDINDDVQFAECFFKLNLNKKKILLAIEPSMFKINQKGEKLYFINSATNILNIKKNDVKNDFYKNNNSYLLLNYIGESDKLIIQNKKDIITLFEICYLNNYPKIILDNLSLFYQYLINSDIIEIMDISTISFYFGYFDNPFRKILDLIFENIDISKNVNCDTIFNSIFKNLNVELKLVSSKDKISISDDNVYKITGSYSFFDHDKLAQYTNFQDNEQSKHYYNNIIDYFLKGSENKEITINEKNPKIINGKYRFTKQMENSNEKQISFNARLINNQNKISKNFKFKAKINIEKENNPKTIEKFTGYFESNIKKVNDTCTIFKNIALKYISDFNFAQYNKNVIKCNELYKALTTPTQYIHPIQEVIMGSGKSSIIAPYLTMLLINNSNYENIYHVVPSSLVNATYNYMLQYINFIYGTSVLIYLFSCNNKSCNNNNDKNKTQKKIYVMDDISFKTLFLIKQKTIMSSQVSFEFNNKNSCVIYDEVDMISNPLTSELNIPDKKLDNLENIDQIHNIAEILYEKLKDEIFWNDYMKKFMATKNDYHYYLLNLDNNIHKEIINKINIDNSKFNKNLYQHIIQKVLPFILTNQYNYNYGLPSTYPDNLNLSDQYKLKAVPYIAVNTPSYGSQFSDPILTLILTIFCFKYIKDKLKVNDKELKLREIDVIQLHKYYKNIIERKKSMVNKYFKNIKELFDENAKPLDYDQYIKNKNFYDNNLKKEMKYPNDLDYIKTIIIPQISNYEKYTDNISFNELLLSDNVTNYVGFTGTGYIYPPKSIDNKNFKPGKEVNNEKVKKNIDSADESDNNYFNNVKEAIEYIISNRIEKVHLNTEPNIVLDLFNFIKQNKKYSVLIDVGALLLSVTIDKIRELLVGSSFKYLFYFEDGNKIVVDINNGIIQKIFLPEQYSETFFYFSNKYITGADAKKEIPVDAHGLITLSYGTTLRDFSQGIYRLRRILTTQKVDVIFDGQITNKIVKEQKGGMIEFYKNYKDSKINIIEKIKDLLKQNQEELNNKQYKLSIKQNIIGLSKIYIPPREIYSMNITNKKDYLNKVKSVLNLEYQFSFETIDSILDSAEKLGKLLPDDQLQRNTIKLKEEKKQLLKYSKYILFMDPSIENIDINDSNIDFYLYHLKKNNMYGVIDVILYLKFQYKKLDINISNINSQSLSIQDSKQIQLQQSQQLQIQESQALILNDSDIVTVSKQLEILDSSSESNIYFLNKKYKQYIYINYLDKVFVVDIAFINHMLTYIDPSILCKITIFNKIQDQFGLSLDEKYIKDLLNNIQKEINEFNTRVNNKYLSHDTYKDKYIKYKIKYINLKKKLNL